MKVINQWIVAGHKLLVQIESGQYYLGRTTNEYGFDLITESEAFKLLNPQNQDL